MTAMCMTIPNTTSVCPHDELSRTTINCLAEENRNKNLDLNTLGFRISKLGKKLFKFHVDLRDLALEGQQRDHVVTTLKADVDAINQRISVMLDSTVSIQKLSQDSTNALIKELPKLKKNFNHLAEVVD